VIQFLCSGMGKFDLAGSIILGQI